MGKKSNAAQKKDLKVSKGRLKIYVNIEIMALQTFHIWCIFVL